MISAFGVDHGISKSISPEKFLRRYPPGGTYDVPLRHLHAISHDSFRRDHDNIRAVTASFRAKGQEHPIHVMPDSLGSRLSLMNGHHRLQAAKKARLRTVKVHVAHHENPYEPFNDPAENSGWKRPKPYLKLGDPVKRTGKRRKRFTR